MAGGGGACGIERGVLTGSERPEADALANS